MNTFLPNSYVFSSQKALPQEWQWLAKEHYDLVDHVFHLIITRNDLMIANISFDSSDRIDKLRLWDVKREQKFDQSFSGKMIAALVLTAIAIITLFIGNSFTIFLLFSAFSGLLATQFILDSPESDDELLDDYYYELHRHKIVLPKKSHLVINYFANSKRI